MPKHSIESTIEVSTTSSEDGDYYSMNFEFNAEEGGAVSIHLYGDMSKTKTVVTNIDDLINAVELLKAMKNHVGV